MDKQFYDDIYHKYKKFVFNTIKKNIFSSSIEDIEDLVSDVFVIAMKNKKLNEYKNVQTWLYKTAINLTINFNINYNKKQSLNTLIDIDIKDAFDLENEITIEEELLLYINELNKELSDNDKKLFNLKFIHKLPDEEIAIILNITTGSAANKSSRLKSKIKSTLNKLMNRKNTTNS